MVPDPDPDINPPGKPGDPADGHLVDAQLPYISLWFCVLWLIPSLVYWVYGFFTQQRRRVFQGASPEAECADTVSEPAPVFQSDFKVLAASIEHSLPDRNVNVIAGGLGKVMNLVARHHPSEIVLVSPMMHRTHDRVGQDGSDAGVPSHYGQPDGEDPPLQLVVDGRDEEVRVWRFVTARHVTTLLLQHPAFLRRSPEAIYPEPMSRVEVLRFFSLWNQAVGRLLVKERPRVYHCPDFHAAIAPWYAQVGHPDLRVLLVLHNAEYQGTVNTEQIRGAKLERVAQIFNLPARAVKDHLVYEGHLNLLKAGVDFVRVHQGGVGVCAVSNHYATEVQQLYSLFWRLPPVQGLENPMLEEERVSTADLAQARAAAKARIQRDLGLRVDPEAKLFVSLGRLVRQKGVDLFADVAPWLLETYPRTQVIFVGPVADGFGHYASHRLQRLASEPRYRDRIFVKFEFWKKPPDIGFAADFCMMPSRDEPFGYVDVEFAWCGALMVGAQTGGLGKVPGFYYSAQNRENLHRLRRELQTAVRHAMAASDADLQRMSAAAVRCRFPLAEWQQRLLDLYEGVVRATAEQAVAGPDDNLTELRSNFDLLPGQQPEGGPPFRGGDDGGDGEFLMQELSEAELRDRMVEKIDTGLGITDILEAVGSDIDMGRETAGTSKWLLRRTLGIQRIHLLIASGYVCSPISESLVAMMASEWGTRANFPLLGSSVDPSLLHVVLFAANALGFTLSAPLWAQSCKNYEPRLVITAALLSQLVLLCALLPVRPTFYGAVALTFVRGIVAGASMLFVVFNFMMSIKADLTMSALRMGCMETLHYCFSWLSTSYVIHSSPARIAGTEADPLPAEVRWLGAPLGIALLLCAAIPGALCYSAPLPFRSNRFPGWSVSSIGRKRSFVFLGIAECLNSVLAFPLSCYVTWWFTNGWTESSLAGFCVIIAGILGVGILLWSLVLRRATVHGFSLLIAIAIYLPPPALLSACSNQEVSGTYVHTGRSRPALLVCVISLLYQGVQSSAVWSAKIRILGSRWRLLSCGTLLIAASQFCAFLSPILCEFIARRESVSFLTRNQKELATAMTVCIVPLSILQYVSQLAAAFFIHADMGVSLVRDTPTNGVRARGGAGGGGGAAHMADCLWRRTYFAKRPILLSAALGLIFVAAISVAQLKEAFAPLPFHPVRRCHDLPAYFWPSMCALRHVDVEDRYALNEYGFDTTANRQCLRTMLKEGGDTFRADALSRTCTVWRCGSPERLRKGVWAHGGGRGGRGAAEAASIYSAHCDLFGQNLIMAHLFEWRWADVAKECTGHLGRAGFDAVQVSPPAEHILGSQWYTRYQPVSYNLNSRSGTEEEFIKMVQECRSANVHVMVDAIINHMAGPYVVWPRMQKCNRSGDAQCVGWAGTRYGNRLFNETDQAQYDQTSFHHYPENINGNCALPPFTNNRHLCDLQGLPDLDTESAYVQNRLVSYLARLHDVGVTMLRIDAAMLIYPASLGAMLQRLPLDYVVQEYYPEALMVERRTLADARAIGAITNFPYGQSIAKILFDYNRYGQWFDNTGSFGKLLDLNSPRTAFPDWPVSVSFGLQFLDNHDQQRERWKVCTDPDEVCDVEATCVWDGDNIGTCRPIYKHGRAYLMAMLFTLAWPFGDATRLMSSYAWRIFPQGPPGTRFNAKSDMATPVWNATAAAGCRLAPDTSPVTEEYDGDKERPWVCEHRWEGVSGLVRMRKDLGAVCRGNWSGCEVRKGSREGGWVHFTVVAQEGGPLSFVALNRGWNFVTQRGSNKTWDLAGVATSLPGGLYCDLASAAQPVAPFGGSPVMPESCSRLIDVAGNGTVLQGTVPSAHVAAIHVHYRNLTSEPPSVVDV